MEDDIEVFSAGQGVWSEKSSPQKFEVRESNRTVVQLVFREFDVAVRTLVHPKWQRAICMLMENEKSHFDRRTIPPVVPGNINVQFAFFLNIEQTRPIFSLFFSLSLRMGSFTSTPKVIPGAGADDADAEYAAAPREGAEDCLRRCARHLGGLPEPIAREWTTENECGNKEEEEEETFRVLQWNVLSQGEHDQFNFPHESYQTNIFKTCSSWDEERQLCPLPRERASLADEEVQDAGGDRQARAGRGLSAGEENKTKAFGFPNSTVSFFISRRWTTSSSCSALCPPSATAASSSPSRTRPACTSKTTRGPTGAPFSTTPTGQNYCFFE